MMGDLMRCGFVVGDMYDYVRLGYLCFICCWFSCFIYGILIFNVMFLFLYIIK